MLRVVAFVLSLVVAIAHASAETVALLPLDGEKRLAIYGQPVAAEVGRALEAAGIDVVVVGANMGVPDRVQLVVDGAIKAGKGDAITLTMRIRNPRDGTVLQTFPASAATLTTIDEAAADLSKRIVPAVRTHLAALAKPTPTDPVTPPPPHQPATPPRASLPALVAAVSAPNPEPARQLLASALAGELARWATEHRRASSPAAAEALARDRAVATVGAAGDRAVGLALEVLAFTVDPGTVPLARARVRVRIVDGKAVRFERVVVTDTIVGDRGISEHDLAARTGREVLAIVNAQLRRQIAGWR